MTTIARITKVGLVGLMSAVLFAACSKGGESNTSTNSATTESSPMAAGTAGAMAAANGASANDGAKVYQTNCSSCHQASGQGIDGTFPPLAGNPVVVGDAKTLIHIVKYGLSGKVAVKGHTFNGVMPSWAQQLSDGDIASVVTYIRSAWGNTASAVSEADVKAVAQ